MKKEVHKEKVYHEDNTSRIDKAVLENFVSLQRVMTNLSIKLDNLTTQVSKLLDLFEISAKALADKDFEIGGESKGVVEKLDRLIDQNKTLARGVSLVHERLVRESSPSQQSMQQVPMKQLIPQNPAFMREMPSIPQRNEPFRQRDQRKTFSQEIEEEQITPKFESPLE